MLYAVLQTLGILRPTCVRREEKNVRFGVLAYAAELCCYSVTNWSVGAKSKDH